jgi:hypothetical protein
MSKPKSITVTLGEEYFSPYPYNGFRVGPITFTVDIDPGESPVAIVRQAVEHLKPAWDELFMFQRDKFHEHYNNKQ